MKKIKIFNLLFLCIFCFCFITACGNNYNIKKNLKENIIINNKVKEQLSNIKTNKIEDDLNISFISIDKNNLTDNYITYSMDNSENFYLLKTNQDLDKITFTKISDDNKFEDLKSFENIKSDTFVIEILIPKDSCDIMMTVLNNEKETSYFITHNENFGIFLLEYENDLSNIQDSTILEYASNINYKMDLDLDGLNEEIIYKVDTLDENSCYIEPSLFIDDVDYSSYLNNLYNISNHFYIGKIDDTILLMFGCISDNDYKYTNIYKYDGKNLVELVKDLQGYPGDNMFIINNILNTTERCDVLATTTIQTQYELKNNKFTKIIPNDFLYVYDTYENVELTVLENIQVYEKMDLESRKITLTNGTKFTSNKTDGEHWANIIIEDKEYWIYIDFENGDYSWMDKIDGLFFAG